MTALLLALQFALCAALIARAGWVLSHSGERIAALTGLSAGWVGLALLATATSLPELASGVSAVVLLQAPNLAVGNALGACVFNLFFLAVVDALQREEPLYRRASDEHLLSAAFGVVMLGLVAMSVLMAETLPSLLHVGVYSPVLLGLYLLALRSVHSRQRRPAHPCDTGSSPPPIPVASPSAGPRTPPTAALAPGDTPARIPTLAAELRRFGLAAAVVLAAGIWLSHLADQLSQAAGWNRSFVGTLFMAFVTTLPEAAVTLSALRLGAIDMAIGNLLGSNLFNVAILAVDDAVYVQGVLLAHASPAHAGTATAAGVMTGLVMVGLVMRPRGRVLRLASWVSIGLAATYVLAATLLYVHGA
jgi:cation:H+ antiporter